MSDPLRFVDFAAISPLLILLVTGLVLLLLESFTQKVAKKYSFWVTLAGLVAALVAAYWAPASHHPLLTPWFAFDGLSHFFTLFFLCIGLASALLASSFFQRFQASRGEYFFLLLSAVFGLILIGAAADFLTLFLGLETLSIALYILCAYMKGWELSREAAVKYFLIGALAAAFFIYGIALIYGAVGTTHLGDLLASYQSLAEPADQAFFLGGIALVTVALAFKAAIVPFHIWAPDVYDGASNPVTAFMAVGTKAGAFAAFARVFLVALPQFNPIWSQAMALLAILTMIYANIVALRQVQLRRFFAYSGISHAGFLLIPILVGSAESLSALGLYLVAYALATFGCFAVLSFLDRTSQGVFLKDLYGLFYHYPILTGVFSLCLLTLAGIPPTIGFFAKFYVFKTAFQAGYYTLVAVGLLTTITSVFYYSRIISVMCSQPTEKEEKTLSSWPAILVGISTCAAIVVFSFFPEFLAKLT